MDKDEQIIEGESRVYEVGFLLVPTLDEAGVTGVVATIKDFLARENASVVSEDSPKIKTLAYTIEEPFEGKIRKFNSAYFGWIKFEGSSTIPDALSVDLKKNQAVIRFLLIKTVKENTMFLPRMYHPGRPLEGGESKRSAKPESGEAVQPKMTTEELDKTIEELVVE